MDISHMKFSGIEISHLLRAWAAVAVAFAIVLHGGLSLDYGFLFAFITAAVTVGSGFLLHELAHKYFAQKYGCQAEFRAFDIMLLLAVIMSFFGFIFAAPGAVFIWGKRVTPKKNGIISVAGPALNIVIALVFLAILIASTNQMVSQIAYYGFYINAWLALFNMIPLAIFDGAKVWHWNKAVWAVVAIAARGVMLLSRIVPKKTL